MSCGALASKANERIDSVNGGIIQNTLSAVNSESIRLNNIFFESGKAELLP